MMTTGDDDGFIPIVPAKGAPTDAELYAEVMEGGAEGPWVVTASSFTEAAARRRDMEPALDGDADEIGFARGMEGHFDNIIVQLLEAVRQAHAQEKTESTRWDLSDASEQIMCDAVDLIGFMRHLGSPEQQGEIFDSAINLIEQAFYIGRSTKGVSNPSPPMVDKPEAKTRRLRGLGVQMRIRQALQRLYPNDPVQEGIARVDIYRAVLKNLEMKDGAFSLPTLDRARGAAWPSDDK